ncbi:hypothetical protein EJ05DRAFT_459313 [Pseudovirgaria hyperparasitica]|uniref:Integral membrane protein n=1 Tax=Pseudovirgaria hyperparasitica TaxID=470096 RepID=A0A6A6WK23_9PEZI|nr:uncharacterized protein EJ05DRAFT_459313 [Pseudovirgaria hyperparasitica]KAF2762557.1 hypothetical protein EJ05DRAFT_459313 [Pseudovirgaria hyperparasitica]
MYSRKSWGGSEEPFILAKFLQKDTGDLNPQVGIVIWEYKDYDYIWKPADEEHNILCDDRNVSEGLCKEEDKGKFILTDDVEESRVAVRTDTVSLKEPHAVNYPILKTGYYCVATTSLVDGVDYTAVIEFRNAFGELPAAQIPKLPFYGGMTIVYAVIGAFWAFLYVQHRQDILPVQNYITAIIVFLVVEMLMTWGFYDYENRHGRNIGSKVLMIVVSILNAGRNSFSFFLLLIVCMGYGVVKPSLGKNMVYVRYLALAHFVFGVIYAIASLTVRPDDAGPLVLLVILPLSATLTAFYVWTLNSLTATMKDLRERKQTVKAGMYRNLWWCILGSILVIFGFFFLNSLTFAGASSPDFAPTHWQTRWFVLDGWLNIVYFADVCFVAYIWRPTANNRRFAMSDEIAQDDEGFEIASLRDSLDDVDDDDDLEGHAANRPPAYDPVRSSGHRRDESPLPAPQPTKPVPPPRESLDGDTIFAVGEEDKWSDDEMDEDEEGDGRGERKRLTGKDD